MEIWIDAQLSPSLALWINNFTSNVIAHSMRALGLQSAEDEAIFKQAKSRNAVIISKDVDFVKLLERFGPPPRIIWVTAGNTSNLQMRELLSRHFATIIEMLNNGESLIELGGV